MILCADARNIPLRDETIQCCVTSPPYWGLRDYGNPNQLGLEKTPEEYVANMVQVFREVRRVLKDDGVLWLNLGDTYTSGTSNNGGYPEKSTLSGFTSPGTKGRRMNESGARARLIHGLKPKDLVGIPWRVAFALQADGWYLRSDVIWSKPNPMPESVTDRPTKAHEYIFLMSKGPRYYYNAESIAEIAEVGNHHRTIFDNGPKAVPPGAPPHTGIRKTGLKQDALGDPRYTGFNARWKAGARAPKGKAETSPRHDGNAWNENSGRGFIPASDKRNKRTVWTVATQPYSGSHFATFPEEIPRLCILAGSRPGDTILDPFGGSGTTRKVALENGRKCVHLDISYHQLAKERGMVTPAMAGLLACE